jgi:hypothetical protein
MNFELPVERLGRRLVVLLESEDPILQGSQRREVAGFERFAGEDREVDLDLVQPRRMDRGVDEGEVRPALPEPVGGFLAAVDRAVRPTRPGGDGRVAPQERL